MKTFLQKAFLNGIAIALISALVPGLQYGNSLKTLAIAAIVLALLNAFIKPFLKVLFIPINVITLGLLGWFVNVIILYLTTVFVPGLTVTGFSLSLFGSTWIFSEFWSFILISFLINATSALIAWLIH